VRLSYFPGCSLHSTAREYDASTRAVCRALGIELRELEDWNCCGSTSAHSLNAALAGLLPRRNLQLAERVGLDLLVPCAACYSRSRFAQAELRAEAEAGGETFYTGRVRVNHLLEVLAEEEIMDRLRGGLKKPLAGLRAVCYYGCLTVRPPKVTGAPDCECPESMDRLVALTGATSLPWSCKTDCCGASLALTRADVVARLVGRLLEMAREAGAECVVVACSMCHANLDLRRQGGLPVFYVSELLGLALDLPEAPRWWKRHLTDPVPLLKTKGLA
jgi:heterodisulfide reductase subunit B